MRCEECDEAELELDEDGPDGKPVWLCQNCCRFWADKDGKPSGPGEKIGEPNLGGRVPPHRPT